VALLNAMEALEGIDADGDEATGIDVVRCSLAEPMRQIAANAGQAGSTVVARVQYMRQQEGNPNIGYDAWLNEYCDMWERGIVDQAKAVRYALTNAAGCASMLLTTEAVITESSGWFRSPEKYLSSMDFYRPDG
jgi:chaperonin GroEL